MSIWEQTKGQLFSTKSNVQFLIFIKLFFSSQVMQTIQNIYIHLPFCLKKCNYCSFSIHPIGKSSDSRNHFQSLETIYVDTLEKEIKKTLKSNQLDQLQSIYFGGGTPSLMGVKSLERILQIFGPNLDRNTEVSIECDPGTFDRSKVQILSQLGFNRISLGVQSFDEVLLKKLNRSHNLDQTFQAIDDIFSVYEASRVSFDLLMNIPDQSESKLFESLEKIQQFQPGHLSIYSLQVEPGSIYHDKFGYRESISPLPDDRIAQQNFEKTHYFMKGLGYDHYEVSSYCKGDKAKSVHNQMYWLGNRDFLGFGMGASSLQSGQRIMRPKTLKKYFEFVDQYIITGEYRNCLIEDEKADCSRIILMSRIRRSQGLNQSEVPDPKIRENINKIMTLYRQEYDGIIDFAEYDKHKQIKLKQPGGYLVCDELVSKITN